MKIPELYRDAYYWLCENVSTNDANVVLDLLRSKTPIEILRRKSGAYPRLTPLLGEKDD